MTLITVASCQLNQWALDFEGNLERIFKSCVEAKAKGASYRLGPELEICGYGCEDHFLENDTIDHCWESLVLLLEKGASDNLLCDFGMPVLFHGARYNSRVLCYNRQILLIRPKSSMADNGNYREPRYFTAYPATNQNQQPQTMLLPLLVQTKFGQHSTKFGLNYITTTDDISIGCELCEELWTPRAAHIDLALKGVEIIGNGSGSHHELRKLRSRIDLITSATKKCGGVYLYANQRGCDGGRLYFDGCTMIVVNGQIVAQAPQFSLQDVCVVTATVDLQEIRSYRAAIPSVGIQSASILSDGDASQILLSDTRLACRDKFARTTPILPQDQVVQHTPEEECCLGPACWLWDYLRRSGAAGFFLPLSGGADSSSVATIVGIMCQLAHTASTVNQQVATDIRRICRKEDDPTWLPESSQELASYILHTTFMGTENSSQQTESRASGLAKAIGAHHLSVKIDLMVQAVVKVFTLTTNRTPRFTSNGGTMQEDLALQNIQARLRMVTAYLYAQLLPWVRGRSGFLLVLGSANVDEGLRGYMTKYDCSSADLNPIGAISKKDLKNMLLYYAKSYPILDEIAGAPPTAELRPQQQAVGGEHSQLDEEEMGMSYSELSWFGKLRKIGRCGPVSMYKKLIGIWSHLSPGEVAQKVKRFFFYYGINRHKMCTITPSYHAEGYSPDDNRFDLRQFLYNSGWTRQFGVIDGLVIEQTTETTKED